MNNQIKPILFLDFDGTISRRDAIDVILEKFADARWLEIEERWKKGAIGSRECLREQIALVSASVDEINELLDGINLDEGFGELLKTCQKLEITPHIISDGFDFCIRRILSQSVTAVNLPIFSSHLEFQNGKWKTAFPYFAENCPHGCATCKPLVMKSLNPHNAPSIFVGDGLSDRYAARAANLVFAKKDLAQYCAAEKIRYAQYENLADVSDVISELLSEKGLFARPAEMFLNTVATQEVYG